MYKIKTSSVISHIIRNLNSFEGYHKDVWETCLHFSAIDQMSIFNGYFNGKLAALEMATVWYGIYIDYDFKGFIIKLHDKYGSELKEFASKFSANEQEVVYKDASAHIGNSIVNDILNELDELIVNYGDELGDIYSQDIGVYPTEKEYSEFIQKALNTFKLDPKFKFNSCTLIRRSHPKYNSEYDYFEMSVEDIDLKDY